MPIDLVNRFAHTPLQATVHLSGRVVALATNSRVLLDRITDLAPGWVVTDACQPDCSWRIVTEPEKDETLESYALSGHCVRDQGIAFVNFGRLSFLAYDEQYRRGISFVSEELVRDARLFVQTFLPALTSLIQGGKRLC